MDAIVTKLLQKHRKSKRETLELKELLAKTKQHKNPDPKVIKAIEQAIADLENALAP